jgi:hypothetical protein
MCQGSGGKGAFFASSAEREQGASSAIDKTRNFIILQFGDMNLKD